VIAILVLNASLIALAAEILVRRMETIVAAGVLVVFILAYAQWAPGLISSSWMPHVYIWPFLLFLAAAASVAAGADRDLWRFVLAGGLLVHGHVAFTMFVVAVTVAVIGSWIALYGRRSLTVVSKRSAITAGALLALFVLPIAIHTLRDFPGELDDYVRTAGSDNGTPKTLRLVVRYIVQYWGADGWAGLGLGTAGGLLALAAALLAPMRTRRFTLLLVAGLGIATLLTMIYAYVGVDDLMYSYLALFSLTVPILTWTVVATSVSRAIATRGGATASIALIVVGASIAGILISRPPIVNPYNDATLGGAYEAIVGDTNPDAPIVLTFQLAWGPAAGIVQQARRDDRPICVDRHERGFIVAFTDQTICDDVDVQTGQELIIVHLNEELPVDATVIFDGVTYLVLRPA
jgi:hypothetical protein